MDFLLKRRPKWPAVLIIPLLLLLSSCAEVRLIGAYDQTVDESIQKISKDVSTMLIEIKKNIADGNSEANKYAAYRPRYTAIEGEIEALRIRCSALEKYDIIRKQVDELAANIRRLEAFHKTGFTSIEPAEQIQKNFETAFTAMIALQNALKREKADRTEK